MVYNNKFVVVVKSKGRVLREQGDTVYIPFGSEYSLLLKNLNSRAAVAKVAVDGSDTLEGNEIIVPANSEVELEGFMRGRKVSNKFKFIEKTQEISNYRGNKPEDGLVRVAFRFEQVVVPIVSFYNNYPPTFNGPYDFTCAYSSQLNSSNQEVYSANINNVSATKGLNDNGITVKGSKSNQTFATGNVGALELDEHVIVLQLKGQLRTKKLTKPITVQTKIICTTCGRHSKSNASYCRNCGTALF